VLYMGIFSGNIIEKFSQPASNVRFVAK